MIQHRLLSRLGSPVLASTLSLGVEAKDAAAKPRIVFRGWATPAKGEHPHDPFVAADGAVWRTGRRANLLGRVDPQEGNIQEFPGKTPDSGPHGLIGGHNGNIWFAAQRGGYIDRLEPRAGELRGYFPKDARKVDAHTPIVDRSGMLWFTAQQADVIGRLDPAKDENELLGAPTKDSLPHCVVVGAGGALSGPYAIAALAGSVWYVETGENQNMLARHDPKTQRFASWPTPSGGGVVRNMTAATGGGGLALTLSGVDKIALVSIGPASLGY
jgi:virginiamycin B lyase